MDREIERKIETFVDQVQAENPELLANFDAERAESVKPERSWIAGFGYPYAQCYVHFFYLSARSICGRHFHAGTFWKNVEAMDRVCGDCLEAVLFMIEDREEVNQ